jgi:hypothetical protein
MALGLTPLRAHCAPGSPKPPGAPRRSRRYLHSSSIIKVIYPGCSRPDEWPPGARMHFVPASPRPGFPCRPHRTDRGRDQAVATGLGPNHGENWQCILEPADSHLNCIQTQVPEITPSDSSQAFRPLKRCEPTRTIQLKRRSLVRRRYADCCPHFDAGRRTPAPDQMKQKPTPIRWLACDAVDGSQCLRHLNPSRHLLRRQIRARAACAIVCARHLLVGVIDFPANSFNSFNPRPLVLVRCANRGLPDAANENPRRFSAVLSKSAEPPYRRIAPTGRIREACMRSLLISARSLYCSTFAVCRSHYLLPKSFTAESLIQIARAAWAIATHCCAMLCHNSVKVPPNF